MYRVKLKTPFNGERFGMFFTNGLGETDVEFTAIRLKSKGYDIEEIKGNVEGYVFDLNKFVLPSNPKDITLDQLKEYSAAREYKGVSNYSKDQLYEHIKTDIFNR